MKLGYQRQVENYRHEDGSYSAWGDKFGNAESGSTWLTAFVIRSFAQASKFISVDNNVLETGIEFLKSCQDRTGKFIERGQVFHSDMQSGTGSGDGLTVYVLISMLEASQALGENYRCHGPKWTLKILKLFKVNRPQVTWAPHI
uniref:Alpha-macroglobulin-like TED domain-containing protein n=1 Tax=Biomphalaria glabrata TaxID=6526 RepID=A0A2C9KLB9_BIOGL